MYVSILFFVIPLPDRPKVFLSGSLQSGLAVKRGEEIRLDANISGFPYPQITWMRDNSTIWPEPLKKRPERPIKKKKKEKEEAKEEADAEKKEADAKKEEDKESKEEDKEKKEEKEKEKEKEVEEPEEPEEAYHPTLNERLTIESKRKGESFIIVNDTIRGDHGIFTIKVENDHWFCLCLL